MKLLLLDCETSPNSVYTWGLWNQNISIDKIIDSSELLCWSAKWYASNDVLYMSKLTGKKKMLRTVHKLLSDCDVAIHYNGNSFDLPVLNKEFVQAGLKPPAPYKSVDLCKIIQRSFRFPSSKLDYVCGALGLETKMKHEGFKLWIDCMAGNEKAWKRMELYNRQDVKILEQLYERLIPWITSHPNYGSFNDKACCPSCGGTKFQKRGTTTTRIFRYQRYQCRCGFWFRDNKPLAVRRGSKFVAVTS